MPTTINDLPNEVLTKILEEVVLSTRAIRFSRFDAVPVPAAVSKLWSELSFEICSQCWTYGSYFRHLHKRKWQSLAAKGKWQKIETGPRNIPIYTFRRLKEDVKKSQALNMYTGEGFRGIW